MRLDRDSLRLRLCRQSYHIKCSPNDTSIIGRYLSELLESLETPKYIAQLDQFRGLLRFSSRGAYGPYGQKLLGLTVPLMC